MGLAAAQLGGVWGFPLTPFTRDRVDHALLAGHVRFQVGGGVDVLCACGGIAQAETLSHEERSACLATVVEAAEERVPVVAALTARQDTAGAAAEAARRGVAGLLLLPGSGDPAELAAVLASIGDAAPGVPVVLYHRPPLLLSGDDLRRLAALPALGGIKDGYRDVRLCRRLRAASERPLLWVSAWEDVALPFWALGFEAFAPASAAYEPRYARAWLGCLCSGDVAGARRLLELHAYPMVDLRLSRPDVEVSVVKAAMACCGLDCGEARPPAKPLTAGEREAVERLVSTLRAVLDEASAADDGPAGSSWSMAR
jgi:4-hydroxy-tetrahydrodipicolinate synthase